MVACNPTLLGQAFASSIERDADDLTLSVAGRDTGRESTPGIVQSLGEPLKPGNMVTVRGGTAATQVLVRAQRDGRIIEARFGALRLGAGRGAVITINAGPSDADVVLLTVPGGQPRQADELRVVRPQPVAVAARGSSTASG